MVRNLVCIHLATDIVLSLESLERYGGTSTCSRSKYFKTCARTGSAGGVANSVAFFDDGLVPLADLSSAQQPIRLEAEVVERIIA